MESTTDIPSTTPTGKPDPRRRDEWILALLLLVDGDPDAARIMFEAHAPRNLRGLLAGKGGWTWDREQQEYISRTGQRIDGPALKRLSILFAANVEHDLRADASRMAVGEIPIDVWQNNMAGDVMDLYVAQSALAAGGLANLDSTILSAVKGNAADPEPPSLAFSLDRLAQFSDDVDQHATRNDTEDAIVNRASLYADSSNGIFEQARRISHREARDGKGRKLYLYERNVLTPGENCTNGEFSEGCWNLTQAGWQPIGSMPLPGLRTCMANCKCSLAFSLIGPALGNN